MKSKNDELGVDLCGSAPVLFLKNDGFHPDV